MFWMTAFEPAIASWTYLQKLDKSQKTAQGNKNQTQTEPNYMFIGGAAQVVDNPPVKNGARDIVLLYEPNIDRLLTMVEWLENDFDLLLATSPIELEEKLYFYKPKAVVCTDETTRQIQCTVDSVSEHPNSRTAPALVHGNTREEILNQLRRALSE